MPSEENRLAVHTRQGWQDLTVEQIRRVWSEERGLSAQTPEQARRTMELELTAVSRRLTIDHLRRRLATCPGKRVLEVGCGWGRIALGMKEVDPQLDYTGVDLSPNLVEMGQALGRELHIPAPYHMQAANAEGLLFDGGSFDFVYGVRVFQFIPDPVKALRECHRVLKPGGAVAIVLPNKLNPARRNYHTRLFFPGEIRQWLRDAGFGDVRQQFYGFWPKVTYEPMTPLVRLAESFGKLPGVRAVGALILVSGRKR